MMAMPVSNSHLHLCLDGQEAPVSLHMDDADDAGIATQASSHDDIELPVGSLAIVKKFELGTQWLLLAFMPLAMLLIEGMLRDAGLQIPRSRRTPFVFSSISFAFRPPLRAPPL